MRIAIIGAGAAGLEALRISLANGHSCEVFEKSGKIGGTWNYTEKIGKDEFGLPIHSSMYEGLRTNLPKELMEYEDFPYKAPEQSFISQTYVLQYIHDYAETFKLIPFIKFYNYVEKVDPSSDEKWSIKIVDLRTEERVQKEYDAVFVCVGNYSVPSIPKLKGIDTFHGSVIHSHVYRKAEPYRNKKVLIIGSGPSGVDIGKRVACVADKAIMSHRSGQVSILEKLSDKLKIKPEIEQFKESSVVFKDGSEEDIDSVIFCTGYIYSYPFLSPECGIEVEGNWVKYLHKHIINIKHPTMAFLGIPFRIFPFPIFGLQVKFFLAHFEGKIAITRDEMMEDVMKHVETVRNPPSHYAHELTVDQLVEYLNDLAEISKIKKLKPVLLKLFRHIQTERVGQIDTSYKLVSDEDFVEIY